MIFLFLVFPFSFCFSLRSDFNSTANFTSPNILQTIACSSVWDFNNPVFCPENTWAYGFQLTNASGYGIMNIALDCRNQTFDQINLVFSQSSSIIQKYNAPGSLLGLSPQNSDVAGCPSGSGDFLRGYYLREWCPTALFQTPQGVVEVKMRNSNNTDITTSVQTTDSSALWTGYSECLSGFAICGFDMKYNNNLLGFFYGAVDIGLKCCRVCEYAEGFFFSSNNNTCSFCDVPCKSCFGTSTNCSDCFVGFTLVGNTCVPQNITQVIASELSSNFSLGNNWSSNLGNINLTVSCSPYWLIGGYPNFVGGSWIARSFTNMPSHYMVRITFRFFKIGAWQLNSYGIISFDSVTFFTIRWDELASPLFYSSDCGSGNILTNSAYRSAYFTHNSSNLTINFTMNSSSGYWGINRINLETQNCDVSCQSCSVIGCTSCPLNNFLTINNMCVSQCVTPYFADMITMKCVSQCPLGYFGDTFSLSCVVNCSQGEFKNINDRLCYVQCPIGFGDPFSGFCVDSCLIGTYPFNNTCAKCDSTCASCQGSSPNQCLSCISGLFLQSNSPSSCLSSCPIQKYPSNINSICLSCDGSCTSCVGPSANQCLSCNFGLFLQSNVGPASCFSSCPNNTYLSQTNQLCISCDSSCLTCAGASSNDCLSCSIGMFLATTAPSSCQSVCSLGYFFNTNTSNCEVCDPSCTSCSGAGPLFCLTYQTYLTLNQTQSNQLNQTQNHSNTTIIISPSIANTTHPLTFLLMFSGSYSSIYEQYLMSSNISIEGFDSSFLKCKITHIEQTQIFMVDIQNVNFSIQGYPLLHLYLNPPSDILSNHSIQLTTYTVETPMEYYFFITPNDWQMINQTIEATDVVSSILSNVFIFSGFFLSGSSTVFSCMLSMDSIRFLRHFQINYPANVASVFHSSLPMLDLIPNFYLEEDPKDNELPQTFQSYGISKYVFNNCGNTIIEGICYWGAGVMSLIVAKLLKNCDNKVVKFILYLLLGIFVWNLTIGYFLANYISITFYTVLALKYPLTSNFMGRFNLFLSILFCCFVVFIFPFSVALIRKIRLKVVPAPQAQYQPATINDFDMMRASVDMRSARILPVKGERKNSDPLSTTNGFPSLNHVLPKTEKAEDLNFVFGSEINFSTDMKKSSMINSAAKTSLESPPTKYKKSSLYLPENKVTLRKKEDVVSKLCQNVIETAKNVEFFNKNDMELKRYETLHKDFKQRTFWQSYFIVWSLLKNLLYCLTIINFYDNPKVGLIIAISLNGFYIVTLLKIRPFKKNVEFLQNLYNELGVYAALIILLYMYNIDEKDNVSTDKEKLKLGWGIVICNSLLVAGFLVRILFSWGGITLAVARNIYNKMKDRALRRKTKINIQDFCMKNDNVEKAGNGKNLGIGMDKSIDL